MSKCRNIATTSFLSEDLSDSVKDFKIIKEIAHGTNLTKLLLGFV